MLIASLMSSIFVCRVSPTQLISRSSPSGVIIRLSKDGKQIRSITAQFTENGTPQSVTLRLTLLDPMPYPWKGTVNVFPYNHANYDYRVQGTITTKAPTTTWNPRILDDGSSQKDWYGKTVNGTKGSSTATITVNRANVDTIPENLEQQVEGSGDIFLTFKGKCYNTQGNDEEASFELLVNCKKFVVIRNSL